MAGSISHKIPVSRQVIYLDVAVEFARLCGYKNGEMIFLDNIRRDFLETIRPSSDLRNHYSDNQMKSELELLRALAEAEQDVINGNLPNYSILRKQGYRILIVERCLIFNKANCNEKIVAVYAIVDGRQEYKNLI